MLTPPGGVRILRNKGESANISTGESGNGRKGKGMEKKRKEIIVTVIGKDEVGIVARVATTMAESNINIIDINQTILGGEIFAMTLLADRIKSPLTLPEITERLQDSVAGMALKVTVQDSEVFQYMHRV